MAQRMLLWLLALGVAGAMPARADVLPLDAEISIGREAAQIIEQAYPLSTDSLMLARVQRIGRRIAGVCGRPDLPFEFHIVDTPDINAFCLPGGFVYVFRGLLQAVPDDDALAFILGHEIGHAVRRHALRQFEKAQVLRVLTAPLSGVLGTFGRDVVNLVLNRKFSRADEAESDTLGLRYATAAGFDTQAGVKAMDTLLQTVGNSHVPGFLASHPDALRRKQAMQSLAQELEQSRPQTTPPVETLPVPEVSWQAPPEEPAPTLFLPLDTGSWWVYRLSLPSGETSKATVRVLEQHPSNPQGVFRMQTAYDGGITTEAWVLPTRAGILRCHPGEQADNRWQTEWQWQDEGNARERVVVPAGEFQCRKAQRLHPDGPVAAEAWFAEGVGLVKCVSRAEGLTQELVSYRIATGKAAFARVAP